MSTPPSSKLGGRRIRHRWVFLTYAQCSVSSKEDFEDSFQEMLDRNEFDKATFYGCQERHKVEGIHYHVLVNFGWQPNWSFGHARQCLVVEGNECSSLNISIPRPRQNPAQFVENHVKYCEKEGDCFGKRPSLASEKVAERKRRWDEIGEQSSPEKKLKLLKEYFPNDFYKSFTNVKNAIDYEHSGEDNGRPYELPSFVDPARFRVPDVILRWEVDNLICRQPGRAMSLLIVGDSRTGKSCLAEYIASRYGRFSLFDTEWNLEGYRPGHACAVFHDMKKGFPYWKGVIGCQADITVHGRYERTKRLSWGVPSIIVANYEDDPRTWSQEVATYISKNSVVYEVPKGSTMLDSSSTWGAPTERWGGEALLYGDNELFCGQIQL